MLSFFSVSLSENIETIKISLKKIGYFYNDFQYFLIVPSDSIQYFESELLDHPNVNIINEDSILSYKEFLEIASNIINTHSDCFNLKWYYQQVLKIAFALNGHNYSNTFSFPVVMFDADSIPIRKIKFFNSKCEIIHYRSLFEYHKDYFIPLLEIFHKFIPLKSGFTVQFFSCTEKLSLYIKSKISEYLNQDINNFSPKNVAELIISSVYNCFGNLYPSKFSEQEFFGYASVIFYNNLKQIPILSFRPWNLRSSLSSSQVKLLSLLGYSLITYEKRGSHDFGFISNRAFLRLLLSDLYFQLKNFVFRFK